MTCRSLRNIFYPQVFPSQRFQIPLDKTLETRNILVADDNAVNAQLAKKMLEKLGQRVRLATNGPELLKLFAQQGADLILMDIQMPLLDGFETTRRLRRTAQGKKVPVLALTAHSLEEERIRCLKAGMDGVLTKPLGFRELIQALKNAENRGKRAG
jgi:CheY-like chemotaxis protein